METEVIRKTEDAIKKIVDEGLTTNNLDTLYKLSKIKHMAKEDESMNYGRYEGRGPIYDAYGRMHEEYGRRGYDTKYRGHDYLGRMYDHYGRYEDDRRGYGAKEDTMRSLEYMLESMVDFVQMLKEDANTQEEMELIRKYTQRIAQM